MIKKANGELLALYAQLYCDEDVSVNIVNNLRERGFNVLCACEAGTLRRDDKAQMAFAVAQKRIMVTHNRQDSEYLCRRYLTENKIHYGLVIRVIQFSAMPLKNAPSPRLGGIVEGTTCWSGPRSGTRAMSQRLVAK